MIREIPQAEVSMTEKCLLYVLATYQGQQTDAYPATEKLALAMSSCRKTVTRTIKSLEQKQMIEVIREHRKSNRYRIVDSVISALVPRDSESHKTESHGDSMSHKKGLRVPQAGTQSPTRGDSESHQLTIKEQSKEQLTDNVVGWDFEISAERMKSWERLLQVMNRHSPRYHTEIDKLKSKLQPREIAAAKHAGGFVRILDAVGTKTETTHRVAYLTYLKDSTAA